MTALLPPSSRIVYDGRVNPNPIIFERRTYLAESIAYGLTDLLPDLLTSCEAHCKNVYQKWTDYK